MIAGPRLNCTFSFRFSGIKNHVFLAVSFGFWLACSLPVQLQAQWPGGDDADRILSFHSVLDIGAGGRIKVRETITVYNGDGRISLEQAEGMSGTPNNDIQRGIVRDFPTRYITSKQFWSKTDFRLLSVTRNGVEENYIEENLSNGIRIKAGRADKLLAPGVYTYVFVYETGKQLIFHSNKDELYWNVNGNGWVFSADTVSCMLHFPDGAFIKDFACYTGLQGSTARDCQVEELTEKDIRFVSMHRLESFEGLTVAASIDKGIFREPGFLTRSLGFLKDNFILPLLSLALLTMLGFYAYFWTKKGRDPQSGTIIPQFEPPAGISPAEAGYLVRQGFHANLFAATLVDAAVHRHLNIEVEQKGKIFKSIQYRFRKPEDSAGDKTSVIGNRYIIPIQELYGLDAEKGKYNPTIKSLYSQLERGLRREMQIGPNQSGGGYFTLNSGYNIAAFLLLLASVAGAFFFVLNYYTQPIFLICLGLVLAMLIVFMVFSRIMKAYSKEGRAIVDHILGFKVYLDAAEQKLFEFQTPPEKTLELFEKYLPYAIALNVENSWAEKFRGVMEKAIAAGYQPAYYRGNMSNFSQGLNMSAISQGVSSGLSSTISSASTPPSSSSGGSSGGGSSGGGGGGGGGGGW